MTAQGVRKLEQAEADGSISLRTLARLANGMDVRFTMCYCLGQTCSIKCSSGHRS
ncbi:hypothetical protein [Hydrogenophaga atypica]|uniref:HTH cro/C1-type domain-containing protein n=1 Tax=Hydrogenophaga atypica TaxID=249409 RepID=A0ABW2QLS3_9BURK